MSCRERLAANRPLEWTGHQEFFAASTQTPNLPLRDSIRCLQHLPSFCIIAKTLISHGRQTPANFKG